MLNVNAQIIDDIVGITLGVMLLIGALWLLVAPALAVAQILCGRLGRLRHRDQLTAEQQTTRTSAASPSVHSATGSPRA